MFYIDGNILLKSNFNSLFEIMLNKDFLVDFLVNFLVDSIM